MRARELLFAAALALLAPACGESGARGRVELAEIEVPGLDGSMQRPLAPSGPLVQALVFITDTCPIANGYAPELGRIAAEFEPRGVGFTFVHVDGELSPEAARAHRDAYELPGTVVIDRQRALVEALGASTTPEAFVLRRNGDEWELWYRGRIDDQVTDFGKKRIAASAPDLRNALDAALAGRPADPARTAAIGCPIPPRP